MDRVTEPKLEVSKTMKSALVDPELMNKYIPQSKPNSYYNASDERGF